MKTKVPIQSDKLGVINILIVDNNPIERLGLRILLESESGFKVVGEATDDLEAVRKVKRASPDVVILDWMLPPMNGFETARQMRTQLPHTRIVIISIVEGKEYIIEAWRSGADAYVLKQTATKDLIVAIKGVLVGRHYISQSSNKESINTDLQNTSSINKDVELDPIQLLTPREREIIPLIIQGYTNREIAQKMGISKRTVETHRSNMMHKLGLKSVIQLMRYVIEHELIPTKES